MKYITTRILLLLSAVNLLAGCGENETHPIAQLASDQKFYFAFSYLDAPPNATGLVVRSGKKCGDEADPDVRLHFPATASGSYELVERLSVDDYFLQKRSVVLDAKMIQGEAHPIYYKGLRGEAKVSSAGNGKTVESRPLKIAVKAQVPARGIGTRSCDGSIELGASQGTYTCFCVWEDGANQECTVKFDADTEPQSCCTSLLDTDTEAVKFAIEAEYCPWLCQDTGDGLAEKWCPKAQSKK